MHSYLVWLSYTNISCWTKEISFAHNWNATVMEWRRRHIFCVFYYMFVYLIYFCVTLRRLTNKVRDRDRKRKKRKRKGVFYYLPRERKEYFLLMAVRVFMKYTNTTMSRECVRSLLCCFCCCCLGRLLQYSHCSKLLIIVVSEIIISNGEISLAMQQNCKTQGISNVKCSGMYTVQTVKSFTLNIAGRNYLTA